MRWIRYGTIDAIFGTPNLILEPCTHGMCTGATSWSEIELLASVETTMAWGAYVKEDDTVVARETCA